MTLTIIGNEMNNNFTLLRGFIGELFNFVSQLNLENDNMKSFRDIN